ASNPLDFDAFVNLLGYKTLELDSEETLIAALSRWDTDNTGYISEER
ncbi:jg10109, partial [Pararge aegeria aegeria]